MKKLLLLIRLLKDIPVFWGDFFLGVMQFNSSFMAGIFRKKIYRTNCFLDTMVTITNWRNFYSKKGSALYHACYVLNANGKFYIGERSHLGAYCYVNVCYGKIVIGNDVAIGPGTKIIAYSNNFRKGRKVTEERIVKDVIIGSNVLIGANCSILPGTIIHDNVVVGAGAVVNGELKSNAIYAGVPAKIIKDGWYE